MSIDQPAPEPLDTGPLTDDDLAVDAVADGTATPAQRDAVDGDATLRARADELIALRSALAEPIAPLPPETADGMIASALDAMIDPSAPRHAPGPERTATPSARSDRTRWLVAAAVALLVAIGAVTLPRLASGRGESNDTATSSAADASTTALGSGSAAADRSSDLTPAEAASGVPSATQDSSADALLVPLGESATVEDIVVRALAALDAQRAGTPDPIAPANAATSDAAAVRTCLAGLPAEGPVELTASGSIAGIEHVVLITTSSTGSPTLVIDVVRIEDCTIVDRVVR